MFPKCSKFDVNFGNLSKNLENLSCFLDNCIWITCCKFSLLGKQHIHGKNFQDYPEW